jgi:sodium/potassium-transporting ATPase subunit alpha
MLNSDTAFEHQVAQSPSSTLAATFQFQSATISLQEEVQRKSMSKERVSIQVQMPEQEFTAKPTAIATTSQSYDFHVATLEDIELRFDTNLQKGLKSDDANQRLREQGPNSVVVKSYRWIWEVIGYYFGGICLLLWPAVILCILAYQPFGVPNPDPTNLGLAGVIFVVILIQGSFSLLQDYSSSKVMKSINAMLPQNATVIRDAAEVSVPVSSLVAGDIVKVETGNRVPADIRLISVQNLKVDASMLTGESEPITCTLHSTDENYMSTRNLAFMGSGIVEGVGYGMVVATGNRTVMGKVAKLAATTNKGTSTLRREANRMVLIIAIIGIATGILLVTYWAAYLRTAYPGFMTVS